jgi:hypothetical protein
MSVQAAEAVPLYTLSHWHGIGEPHDVYDGI